MIFMFHNFNSNQISVFLDNVKKEKFKFIEQPRDIRRPKYEGENSKEFVIYLPDEDCIVTATYYLGSGKKNFQMNWNHTLLDQKYVRSGEDMLHYIARKYGVK
jgi:hypothetical protein